MGGDKGTPAGRGAGPPGCKVLVVEDGFVVALGIAEALRELGCAPLGPAASAAEALALLARERPDAALLDAGLPGGDGGAGAVAAALAAASVPFAVVTGYDRAALAPALRAAPYLGKPFGDAELEALLRGLLLAPAGAASAPPPSAP
jgi:CheY-like chemotaxis protein